MQPSNVMLIQHIELILNELVETAEKLVLLSQQPMLEEEVANLQQEEQRLFHQLQGLDRVLSLSDSEALTSSEYLSVKGLLEKFQKLNQSFIENVNSRKGLLLFEKTGNLPFPKIN